MWFAAAVGTALCFGVNNSLFKWGTTRHLSKIGVQFFFYGIAFLLMLLYGLVTHSFHESLFSLVIGGLIGILNTNGNIQMGKAFEKGPASITSTLIAMNVLIPIALGAVFFPETIALLQWLGIALMVGAAVVVQYRPGGGGQPADYRQWVFRIALALLSIGAVGFLMKVASSAGVSLVDIMTAMYGGGLAYLGVLMLRERAHLQELKVGSVVGLLSVCGYGFYMYALQHGPASVVFPVISLNCLVVMVAGVFLYKERLKLYQLFGLAVALAGIVLARL
ncbi:hypothetical protein J31TS4_33920 [Paenibacillus sp. J31TS4]|uniref:DMT family transporter n=1 Tax=Paenibacillus sp. J31TS4 TaxID=2807195 RepID=UPI001B2CA94B|nr:DMT family transporter [Paenibacillus sp. J31TS4]GIP40112.1 hypothetical protein J31TS4_33920 [Paenibacillus sp. J31TS4]